jgi:hypothetical protein
VLQGTLDGFGIGDVLTLLATTAKTGRLHLNGDRGTGSLWLEGGEIVGGTAARTAPDAGCVDVAFELLRFERGEFSFTADDVSGDPVPPTPVIEVLEQANALLAEWHELSAVVPSLGHRVVLVAELLDDEVTLDRESWRAVLGIAGGQTVAGLGEALGLAEVPVLRRVCDLLDRGLVQVLDPAPAGPPLGATFAAEPAFEPAIDHGRRWDDPGAGDGEPSPVDAPGADPLLGRIEAADAPAEHLGGFSPRAAQAVSEATGDNPLLAFLRNED